MTAERVAELEMERVAHRAERRIFVAMLLRAAREMREPVTRAGYLEELEALVPGSLDGLPETMQPAALRRRSA